MVPSVVQRTRQPRATANSFGTALSAAAAWRGSSGIRMTPGCATARDIDIPLDANEPARSVAVSIEVRRETSVSRSVPVPSPRTTAYARPKPIHFQSGEGATSHTLSTCAWNPRASSPKKKPLGTGSFSTPAGFATTSTAFRSGEKTHDTRSAIPCVPRLTGVTVTTGAACVVSAAGRFFEEPTGPPATRKSREREEGRGQRDRQNTQGVARGTTGRRGGRADWGRL